MFYLHFLVQLNTMGPRADFSDPSLCRHYVRSFEHLLSISQSQLVFVAVRRVNDSSQRLTVTLVLVIVKLLIIGIMHKGRTIGRFVSLASTKIVVSSESALWNLFGLDLDVVVRLLDVPSSLGQV